MVRFAVGNTEDALDLMQETMLTFVRLYSSQGKKNAFIEFYIAGLPIGTGGRLFEKASAMVWFLRKRTEEKFAGRFR
jgi:hypothetical protein